MKEREDGNLAVLGGSLFMLTLFVLAILAWQRPDEKLKVGPRAPIVEAKVKKTVVTTNNPVMVHGEKKEEIGEVVQAVCNTNVPKAVFTADKNKMKKHLKKKLAEEQSKNVN